MINEMELSSKAYLLRKKLGTDESSPIDIFTIIQSIKNLTLICYPLGTNISGICYKGDISNVIVINSEMSLGRQRFSLAHELYHLYYDKNNLKTISTVNIGCGDENEKKADKFASYFLIPQSALYDKTNNKKLTIEEIIKLEQYFGVSHRAMLFRLLEEKIITKKQIEKMQSNIINTAIRLGYDTSLYYSLPENRKINVLGYHISQVEKLFEKELISLGKYEEMLLDAFRDDIVYGSELLGGDIID